MNYKDCKYYYDRLIKTSKEHELEKYRKVPICTVYIILLIVIVPVEPIFFPFYDSDTLMKEKTHHIPQRMYIHIIPGYQYDSNIYVVTGKTPTIIDTGTGLYHHNILNQIREVIDPSKIIQIILTHEHFDHTGGVKKIYEQTEGNAQIIAHAYASKKIENGDSFFAELLGGEMPKMPVDVKLSGNETLQVGNEMFLVLSTPGHTPGCICLYSEKSKTLFSGDTVFAHGSYGRYDFPGGNLTQLKESLRLLHLLDVENLYPGHEEIVEKDGKRHIRLSLQNIESIKY